MPVAEFLEDYEQENSGRIIEKGTQHMVTRDHMKELEDEGIAVQVGSGGSKNVQDRTRGVNEAVQGEKSQRVKKKVNNSKVSTDMDAKDAVSHIKDTKAADLQGFVPDDEDRKTVLEAWESKQEESE